ncbi:hypothetical protein BIV57_11660 [Mangrovactinospora gilvigrisea]|uniref:BACON domain-containing protein n=1 Tax=Mangrovactinospora gilvigrisea TaxID=1428644 RepID=A0A1J7C6Z0_9ACTN|nr:hypothetical protein BIV57_11660 [Mangrovactinospora gilvigrisea]
MQAHARTGRPGGRLGDRLASDDAAGTGTEGSADGTSGDAPDGSSPGPSDGESRVRAAYAVCADGLFTYCLSVLSDHEAAAAASSRVLRLAVEHHGVLADERLLRAWLYALARDECLRRLAAVGGDPAALTRAAAVAEPGERRRRRAELGLLSWPEAAGLSARQREALELAVRHGLEPDEVAAVLGMADSGPTGARELLAGAASEVERTRATLAVAESGGCPGLTRIADSRTGLVGAALRRELVRHAEGCARCAALREAGVAAGAPAEPLPVIAAPEEARGDGGPASTRARLARRAGRRGRLARRAGRRGRRGGGAGTDSGAAEEGAAAPEFDRRGFPVRRPARGAFRGPGGRPVLRRALVMTATLLLVAAPLVVLWAVDRSFRLSDDPPEVSIFRARVGVSSADRVGDVSGDSPLEHGTGAAASAGSGGSSGGPDGTATATPSASASSSAGASGAGRLALSAVVSGGRTVVTLRNGGDAAVDWRAVPRAGSAVWLAVQPSSGRVAPGGAVRVVISADREAAPAGQWSAEVEFPPSGRSVTVSGEGRSAPPTEPPTPTPTPSAASPTPSGSPSAR